MNIAKLSNYISKNNLSESQLVKVLTELKRSIFNYGYKRGYWTRDADLKKIRRARDQRLRKEHETKELNQDK